MELSGILTFASIFVAILVVLAGIAYHFMREQEDVIPDANAGTTSTNSKKSKKTQQQQQHQRDSSAKAKQQKAANKVESSKKSNSDKSEPEEEPIVIIPDPFTKQINSRYASVMGTNVGSNQQTVKKESNHVEKKHVSNHVVVANGTVQKQKEEHQSNQTLNVNYKNSDFITANPVVNVNQASVAASSFASNNKINFDKTNADAAKVRPKATVKPNQASSYASTNGTVEKVANNLQTTNKPVSMIPQPNVLAKSLPEKDISKLVKTVSNTLGSKGPITEQVLQAANVMIAPSSETDKLKIQQLNDSLNEKLKQLDTLNQTNTNLKNEVAKLNTRVSDFESLKSTNQVIQRELTKWTQKCSSLEKEKALTEEKLRVELENLRKTESTLLERIQKLESSKPVESAPKHDNVNVKEYESQINYLQNELTELQKRLKDSDESHLKKIQELSSRVLSSDSLVKDSQMENQKLNAKLTELNEKNKELSETLQTNEEYIKKIDAQLSSSVNLINELKSNENQLDNHNKMLQSKQESELNNLKETLETKSREIDNLKKENNTLLSQIEELKTQKHSQQNGHSEPKIEKDEESLKQKDAEIKTLKAKVEETTKTINTLNGQIDVCESKIVDLEKKIEIFKESEQKLKNAQSAVKPDTESKEKLAQKTAELEKEKERVKKLESELESERKKLSELKQKAPAVVKEVPSDIEKKLKTLAEENQKLKSTNFNLKSIWEATEQSMVSLENSIEQNEKRLNDEINTQKATVKQLQDELEKVKKDQTKTSEPTENGVSKHKTSKVNGVNGGMNGHQNGNGHHASDDEDVTQLKKQLETYKQENDTLKQIIEEESRSGKLSDRSQIRKILKFGQEKLEKEMIIVEKLQEKFEKH